NILFARLGIGPGKEVSQQLDAVQFVDSQDAFYVKAFRHFDEGQGTEVVLDERDVGGQARDPLIDVLEGLEVRQVNHREKGLLEWILYLSCCVDNEIEQGFDALGD